MTSIALPRRGRPQLARSEVYGARYLIAFAVTLASVLELVDTSIVNVAIPHMMGNLGATLDEIAWVSTGYIVANVIILPLTGWLSERLGRRNYYTGSIALFTLASFFCGHATTLHDLVFWRVVQGIGGGALISTAQAILFDVFPRREAGTAMAIFGMGVMVGPTLGPTLGGWITDNYAWPWIFYINIPLGILAAMLTWRYVPEPDHHIDMPDHVDWKGLALLILGIGALQIFLERGESHDWFASREIVVEAGIAGTALLLFIWHELRTAHPVVNLRILANRQLATGVVFGLLLGFALYSSVFALPVFLQNLLGYTAWDTGRVILPGALASAVTMAVAGRLNRRIDARLSITAGILLFGYSMWLHYHFTMELGMGDLLWPMIFRGVAMGLIFVPLTAATVADLPSKSMAQGTGLFNLSRQLGGSFGIAITATLLARYTETARDALRPHLSVSDLGPRQWMAGIEQVFLRQGGTPGEAAQRASALLEGVVHQQASVIAFEKVFLTMGLAFLLALPLLLLFRTGKAAAGAGPAH
ncbi:MAG TPA: DHA2 family efflux MFS transporter permease subunit [Gemmatimonadales bacterium]|nr:DHA2 family efflux MFS transporter permease subunit [Gemmatimonadales bacterium]